MAEEPRTVAESVQALIPSAKLGTDRELLRLAVLALRPDAGETMPRWGLVLGAMPKEADGAAFRAVHVARCVCVALGIDPDELVTADVPEWIDEVLNGRDAPFSPEQEAEAVANVLRGVDELPGPAAEGASQVMDLDGKPATLDALRLTNLEPEEVERFVSAFKAATANEPIMPLAPTECTWTEDEDGLWVASCHDSPWAPPHNVRAVFAFDAGGPGANRFRFCPYCARPLVERTADTDTDALSDDELDEELRRAGLDPNEAVARVLSSVRAATDTDTDGGGSVAPVVYVGPAGAEGWQWAHGASLVSGHATRAVAMARCEAYLRERSLSFALDADGNAAWHVVDERETEENRLWALELKALNPA